MEGIAQNMSELDKKPSQVGGMLIDPSAHDSRISPLEAARLCLEASMAIGSTGRTAAKNKDARRRTTKMAATTAYQLPQSLLSYGEDVGDRIESGSTIVLALIAIGQLEVQQLELRSKLKSWMYKKLGRGTEKCASKSVALISALHRACTTDATNPSDNNRWLRFYARIHGFDFATVNDMG